MHRVLTDTEITLLLAERKPLPDNWQKRLCPRAKSDGSYTQCELDLNGSNGRKYRVIIRGSTINPLDFSLILVFRDEDGSDYRLVRFNGRHPSRHTNKWEKARKLPNAVFHGRFHIHMATERYQLEGYEIDGYAEVTDRFDSFESALHAFVRSNGLILPMKDREEVVPGLFDSREEDHP